MLRKLISLSLLGLLAAKNPCDPDEPADVQVTTEELDGGKTTKTTTVTTCPDGSKHTKTQTKGSSLVKEVKKVKVYDFHYEWEGDEFILHHYNDKPKVKDGYVMIKPQWVSQLWGYFANYYFTYGGIKSYGWERSGSNAEVCMNSIAFKRVHAEQDYDAPMTVEDALRLVEEAHEEGIYKLCPDGINCWNKEDAVNFRDSQSLVINFDKNHCKNKLAIWVKIDWLGIPGIKYKKKGEDEGPPGPGKVCNREDGCPSPVNVFVGGFRIRMGAWTFVLGEHDKIDEDRYRIVTPKHLNNGFWQYFLQFYARFKRIRHIGDWESDSVCLGPVGSGNRLGNFLNNEKSTELIAKNGLENLTSAELAKQVHTVAENAGYSNDDECETYQFCYLGTCFDSIEDFADSQVEKLQFSNNKNSCGGRMNLYVQVRLYEAITVSWKEEEWEDNDYDFENPTTAPATTTPEPLPETTPEPVVTTPEPVVTEPETTPEPVVTEPETTPEPVVTTHDPVVTEPETTPEPVVTTPEAGPETTPEVDPETTPEPIVTTPEPVVTTQEPEPANCCEKNVDRMLTALEQLKLIKEKTAALRKVYETQLAAANAEKIAVNKQVDEEIEKLKKLASKNPFLDQANKNSAEFVVEQVETINDLSEKVSDIESCFGDLMTVGCSDNQEPDSDNLDGIKLAEDNIFPALCHSEDGAIPGYVLSDQSSECVYVFDEQEKVATEFQLFTEFQLVNEPSDELLIGNETAEDIDLWAVYCKSYGTMDWWPGKMSNGTCFASSGAVFDSDNYKVVKVNKMTPR